MWAQSHLFYLHLARTHAHARGCCCQGLQQSSPSPPPLPYPALPPHTRVRTHGCGGATYRLLPPNRPTTATARPSTYRRVRGERGRQRAHGVVRTCYRLSTATACLLFSLLPLRTTTYGFGRACSHRVCSSVYYSMGLGVCNTEAMSEVTTFIP